MILYIPNQTNLKYLISLACCFSNIEILEEGETTTSCSIMYDIVRKFNNEKKINFNLVSENKIEEMNGKNTII